MWGGFGGLRQRVAVILKAREGRPRFGIRNSRSVFEVTPGLRKKTSRRWPSAPRRLRHGSGCEVEENNDVVPRYRSQPAERCDISSGHWVQYLPTGFVVRRYRSTALTEGAPHLRWGALSRLAVQLAKTLNPGKYVEIGVSISESLSSALRT